MRKAAKEFASELSRIYVKCLINSSYQSRIFGRNPSREEARNDSSAVQTSQHLSRTFLAGKLLVRQEVRAFCRTLRIFYLRIKNTLTHTITLNNFPRVSYCITVSRTPCAMPELRLLCPGHLPLSVRHRFINSLVSLSPWSSCFHSSNGGPL